MNFKLFFIFSAIISAFATISVHQTAAQSSMTLTAVGSGEKVKLAVNGKSKIVVLEGTNSGDFTAGGDPPHRYTTLLSVQKGGSFYLVAKFLSGPAISDPNAACGGDRPTTLLLVKANKNLKLENVQTEIYDSCIYNGSGRYAKGKPSVTKNKVKINFDEGDKKYALVFDAGDAEKGLQTLDR